MNKPKVCFVAPYSYPLFNPQSQTMFGGWEVRIALIAKELAKRGNYAVSIIVADHGQPHKEIIEGVELITWKGKAMWGIPPVVEDPPKPGNQTSMPSSVLQESPSSINQVGTVTPEISPIIATAEQPAKFKPSQILSLTKKGLKKIYKQIVPWRIRIVITGFLSGLKRGLSYLIKSMLRPIRDGVVFVAKIVQRFLSGLMRAIGNVIKALLRPIRVAAALFADQMRLSLTVSKRAIGNIADEPVYPEMVSIYAEVDADIYVVPGNSQISAEVAWFCKKNKRAYIMMAGSDIDFSPEIKTKPYGADLYGTRYFFKLYALRNASVHIVQNSQQARLARTYGCSPVLIPNPIDLELKFQKSVDPKLILWVGNTVERVKHPSIFVETARQLPMYQFLMIVTTEQQIDYERIAQSAQSVSNLSMLTRVPFVEVEKYFAQAKLFVNTSAFEGFPNTFLQSGKYGVPIVSLAVDPNGIISQHGCGMLCNDDSGILVANIHKMMTETDFYRKTSTNILTYLQQFHDKEKIIPQYEEVFQSVVKRRKA
jgi:glycosyltransferase involved in cell wall biosynthesis